MTRRSAPHRAEVNMKIDSENWNARTSAKRSIFIQNKHRWHLDGQKLARVNTLFGQIEAERINAEVLNSEKENGTAQADCPAQGD